MKLKNAEQYLAKYNIIAKSSPCINTNRNVNLKS